jgi:hypothetical protein
MDDLSVMVREVRVSSALREGRGSGKRKRKAEYITTDNNEQAPA